MRKALSNVNSLKAVQSLKLLAQFFFCIKLGDRLKFICRKRVSVQAIILEKTFDPHVHCAFSDVYKKITNLAADVVFCAIFRKVDITNLLQE